MQLLSFSRHTLQTLLNKYATPAAVCKQIYQNNKILNTNMHQKAYKVKIPSCKVMQVFVHMQVIEVVCDRHAFCVQLNIYTVYIYIYIYITFGDASESCTWFLCTMCLLHIYHRIYTHCTII